MSDMRPEGNEANVISSGTDSTVTTLSTKNDISQHHHPGNLHTVPTTPGRKTPRTTMLEHFLSGFYRLNITVALQ